MDQQNRRSFLRRNLKLATFVIFSNPLTRLFGENKPLPTWSELIGYARWCPNVHNLQPHKIKILTPTTAGLYYDPSRLLPIGDPNSVFATVAMGIFITHLSIAASYHGMKVEIDQIFEPITTTATRYTLFANLKLVQLIEDEMLDRELILKRRTARQHYNGNSIKDNVLVKMEKESRKFGHEFFATNDPEKIDLIVRLNQEALFADLKSERNRRELDQLFRYTKQEASVKRDGLWSKCMGFSGILMKSVFQHPERWSKGLQRKLLSNHYKASFNGTGTICWFCGDFKSPKDWLLAGKMLARNWLLITQEKAYIQPFGSLITNAHAYEKIYEKFPSPAGKPIWMIFRAGYTNEPTRSYRLNVDEIII